MDLSQYKALFPLEKVWREATGSKAAAILCEGMLQFDEDSACNLAGPFEGNYAYFSIIDYRKMTGWVLLTESEHRQRHRFEPIQFKSKPAESEEHLQRRLAALSALELNEWKLKQANYTCYDPTVERPFGLRVAGNDDSTWTKYFSTEQAAREELALLEATQPLVWYDAIRKNDFVFTN